MGTSSEIIKRMLAEYLARIHLSPPLPPTADSLRRLQLAHLLSIPFEDLDIHLARPIRLDLPSLFAKIVTHRRGGFCYELNGLFAWLLRELGYSVSLLSASDFRADGSSSPTFDHLALQVHCPADPRNESLPPRLPSEGSRGVWGDSQPDVTWLADVGYGDTFRLPLRLDSEDEQDGGLRTYRLSRAGEVYQLWERNSKGGWERQYFFNLQPHTFAEFEPMCRFHQSSPDSPLPRWRICTLATPDGRITLDNARQIVTHGGEREERSFSEEEYPGLLKQYFGIDL